MKKSHKKIDHSICQALTLVCESAKADDQGFEWITHRVNYNDFPNSLCITCVFSNRESLLAAKEKAYDEVLMADIVSKLSRINIILNPTKQIDFATEDAMDKRYH